MEVDLSPGTPFRPTMASDIIGVIGASRADDELLRLAEELGQEIASRGVAIVCGGMTGVMEAVCKGARAKGGLTIGIIEPPPRIPRSSGRGGIEAANLLPGTGIRLLEKTVSY